MHRVSRCYLSEISRAAKKRSPKITWGRMGFTWFTGYRTFWREGWAGTQGRNPGEELMQCGGALRAGLLPWIAQLPFLYCKVAPTVVCTLNEQSRKHSHRTCTEQSDGAVPVLRFPFPRCVKVPTEAKCAGCRVKDPRVCVCGGGETLGY